MIAVSLVIFIAITLWFTSPWEAGDSPQISDKEVIHQISERLRARWPQVPGPPLTYREQSGQAAVLGDHARALQRTAMALALDRDDLDSWVQLVVLSAQVDAPEALSVAESAAVLLEVSALAPEHPELATAMGWVAHRRGDSEGALRSVGTQPRRLNGRLLRLNALAESATLTDGEAVLELAPAHGPVCRWTAQHAHDGGQTPRAVQVLSQCVGAGADAQTGEMLAELVGLPPAQAGENGSKTLDSTPSSP